MNNSTIDKLFIASNERLLDAGLFLLRAIIGVILFMVGTGKVLGWFGGHGISLALHGYAMSAFPPFWAFLSMFTEFIGGFLLFIGLFARLTAIPVIINMLVATIVMWPRGFLTGADLPFTLLVIAVIILITGPGSFSIDRLIFRSRGYAW